MVKVVEEEAEEEAEGVRAEEGKEEEEANSIVSS